MKRLDHPHRDPAGSIPSNKSSLDALRSAAHPFCVVCSKSNPMGLGLTYALARDGSVHASFLRHPALEGFQGVLHGGIVSALSDGAMLHCVFAHGYVGMTAELKIRYRSPVLIGDEMLVRARLIGGRPPFFHLHAELTRTGQVKALATGKFMQRNCKPCGDAHAV